MLIQRYAGSRQAKFLRRKSFRGLVGIAPSDWNVTFKREKILGFRDNLGEVKGLFPQVDAENLEQLPEADQVDLAFYSHEIPVACQIFFHVRQKKYDFVQAESEPADQQVILVVKIIYLAVMNEFPVHHSVHQFMHELLRQIPVFQYIPVNPEKIERPYRRIEPFFRK